MNGLKNGGTLFYLFELSYFQLKVFWRPRKYFNQNIFREKRKIYMKNFWHHIHSYKLCRFGFLLLTFPNKFLPSFLSCLGFVFFFFDQRVINVGIFIHVCHVTLISSQNFIYDLYNLFIGIDKSVRLVSHAEITFNYKYCIINH